MKTPLLLALALAFAPAQEFRQVGVAPGDTDTFRVDTTLAVTSKGKTALDYRSEMQVVFTARKTETGATIQGRVIRFIFAGTAGDSTLDIKWVYGQTKIDDVAWGTATNLRKVVNEGFAVELDRAGNPVSCTSTEMRMLAMGFDPLIVGAATWFDGGTRAVGDRWTSTFQNAEAEVACSNDYDKVEGGAAIIKTAFSIKDRRSAETPPGGGTGRTDVDVATGRPRGCTVSIDFPSKETPVHLEATTSVTPGKRP